MTSILSVAFGILLAVAAALIVNDIREACRRRVRVTMTGGFVLPGEEIVLFDSEERRRP